VEGKVNLVVEKPRQIVIRNPYGVPMLAEFLDYVEIGGVRFALIKNGECFTVTELSTGTNIGESTKNTDIAVARAKLKFEEKGIAEFEKAVRETLQTFGNLPSIEDVKRKRKAK